MTELTHHDTRSARLQMIFSMALFGTIGLFVRSIALPSSVIALVRGAIGAIFMLLYSAVRGRKLDRSAIRANALILCLSGAAIGFNWILLFEAYRYTTVAAATVCYYFAPVLAMLASPLVLHERMTLRRTVAAVLALLGTALISDLGSGGAVKGILLGLGAALFYASIILLNKKLRGINAIDCTVVQLGCSTLTLCPYVLLTLRGERLAADAGSLALLAFVGIVHTGITYCMYFGAMSRLRAQTVAIYSYIDPLVAVLLSAAVLCEPFGLRELLGALLVLGSTLWSELSELRARITEKP